MTDRTRNRPNPGKGRAAREARRAPATTTIPTPDTTAPHEASAWLRSQIRRQLALVRTLGLDPHTHPATIILPLGEPTRPGTREDRCCDRCGTHAPDKDTFVLVLLQAAPRVLLGGGLCVPCMALEGAL